MPIPGEVEGALAAPALPGPTSSLTKHRSLAAVGVLGVTTVPDKAIWSPALNDLTSATVVFASGLNAVFIVSSQANATGAGGGAGAAGGGGASSPPPQACRAARVANAPESASRRKA